MRLLIATAATLLAAVPASALTLLNGSFEDGTTAGASGFTTLNTGDTTSITGWEVLSDGVDYIGAFWQASDGNRSLDLSALTAGGVMQMVTDAVAGQSYRVSFDVSANPDGPLGSKSILVSVTGGVAQQYFYELTAANSTSNMLYQTFTYDFVASGALQGIQFRSGEFSPFGTVLDNVRIDFLASAIPEPATWALMIGGFTMVGLGARRRRGAVAA